MSALACCVRIAGSCWLPTSLGKTNQNKPRGPRLKERPCLKEIRWKVTEDTRCSALASVCIQVHMHTHAHVSTLSDSDTERQRQMGKKRQREIGGKGEIQRDREPPSVLNRSLEGFRTNCPYIWRDYYICHSDPTDEFPTPLSQTQGRTKYLLAEV